MRIAVFLLLLTACASGEESNDRRMAMKQHQLPRSGLSRATCFRRPMSRT